MKAVRAEDRPMTPSADQVRLAHLSAILRAIALSRKDSGLLLRRLADAYEMSAVGPVG
jgi:hypothetical protein